MKIGKKEIGIDKEPYFIADISSNHDNNLDRALKLIELAKEAGADAAKFQNFNARNLISKNGFDRLRELAELNIDEQRDFYEECLNSSIPAEWIGTLAKKCEEMEIDYIASAYDFTSVELLDSYVNAFKIGSGDITWHEIIAHIASKDKPVILATGASELDEVKMAMDVALQKNKQIILMQSNSNYSGNRENCKHINLRVLSQYNEIYPEIVMGLSDHTPGISVVLGAVALGARVIEKHFTDDKSRSGSDHNFSLMPNEWKNMKDGALEVFYALGDGVKKIEDNEKEEALLIRRSLYFSRHLPKGTIVKSRDLVALRPCLKDGIEPHRRRELEGKPLRKDVIEGSVVYEEHI